MSDNVQVIVDTDKINRMIDELRMSDRETRQAVRRGISQAAGLIQKQAKNNLSTVTNSDGTSLDSKNLKQFVRLTVYKDTQGARVDILDDKRGSTNRRLAKKGLENKSFVLKFFELGAVDRYRKSRKIIRIGGRKNYTRTGKGGYTGTIVASHFFTQAVSSKQGEAERVLESFIINNIQRVANKRK